MPQGSGRLAGRNCKQSPGTGSLRIRSNRISNLYPGAKRTLTLTIHNTSKHAVGFALCAFVISARRSAVCAPTRRNLTIRRQKPRAFRLRSGASRRVVFLVTMPNTVADACQQGCLRPSLQGGSRNERRDEAAASVRHCRRRAPRRHGKRLCLLDGDILRRQQRISRGGHRQPRNNPSAAPSPTGRAVTISWGASTLSNGAALGGYLVKRYPAGGGAATISPIGNCTGTESPGSLAPRRTPPRERGATRSRP